MALEYPQSDTARDIPQPQGKISAGRDQPTWIKKSKAKNYILVALQHGNRLARFHIPQANVPI
jgi:hypothetical protein